MFEPNFNYTNKIVKNLIKIGETKTFILNTPLIPKWEVSLRKESILKSAHSSTAIEGNNLSLDQVSELAKGREIMASRKDKQEVLNYLNALKKIPKIAEEPFSLERLLEIHKTITKNTLEYFENEGNLRFRQVYVVNQRREVVFTPPETEEVPYLIEEFIDWLNSIDFNEIDAVVVAGIAHYELVRIHPFIDGNGRTARILATYILYKSGFDLKRFFALDDYYDMNRQNYYQALNSVNPETLDLTQWLEYFIEGIEYSLKSVKEKVIGISKDIKILKEKGQIALDERQMAIVEKMVSEGQITNEDVRKMFSLSRSAAKKELTKLLELGVVKLEGKGRNAHYILT